MLTCGSGSVACRSACGSVSPRLQIDTVITKSDPPSTDADAHAKCLGGRSAEECAYGTHTQHIRKVAIENMPHKPLPPSLYEDHKVQLRTAVIPRYTDEIDL